MEATTAVRDGLTAKTPHLDEALCKPVSVCLLGQPYWVEKLEAGINTFATSRLRAFQLPLSSLSFFRSFRMALSADLIVRVGFRPGARTVRGRAFDGLWSMLRFFNPGAARVFYWLGSDVLQTTEDLRSGKLRLRCYSQAKKDLHLADAPWLVEELQQADIRALSMTVTLPPIFNGETPDLPLDFSVLTYIPDGRHRFYGGDCIYQAAKTLPGVRFDVVGGLGTWASPPLPNLFFHGWQSDMAPFYQRATVLVRMVKHDGTGLTAVEALSLARHVIYSFPMPHTRPVAWGESDRLAETVGELSNLHERGLLRLNTEGKLYAETNFDHRRRMEALISYFLEIARPSSHRRTI